jgi:serine/threonine protein phosphatase PrpC
MVGYFKDKQWKYKQLTRDHKPDLPEERERILENKGRVEPYIMDDGEECGPHRVWLAEENVPGLAMSRSIGDLVAASVGVTWQPEISNYQVGEFDKFLIVASDGVWEFMDN